MKILLLCGDQWHPQQVPAGGITPLHGFQFDIITSDFSPQILHQYPAVLFCRMDDSQSVQKVLADYVEAGGGLTVVHSGIVNLEQLTGCRFLDHPDICPVTIQPAKPHPVTEGIESFCETDEHYRIEIIDAEILISSYSQHHNTPAGFARTQGKGRVCVLTPGHNLNMWLNPNFQRLLTNALNWCASK
ncbi:MAG: ThuA domain-containing protein [Treponema sp.]|nr:ThuA domain-containing protein [Treponema sp.]